MFLPVRIHKQRRIPRNIVLAPSAPRTLLSVRSMKTAADLLVPTKLDALLSSSWVRHHLYILGYDIVKLNLYQKFSHLLSVGGGGFIKNVVFDLSAFIKRELATEPGAGSSAQQLMDLMYFGPNQTRYAAAAKDQLHAQVFSRYRIPAFRWFFILVGYMLIHRPESEFHDLTDRIVDIYFQLTQNELVSAPPDGSRLEDAALIDVCNHYFDNVEVDYDLLFSSPKDFHITMHDLKDYKIELPPLPRIRDKRLLLKALMHKELVGALLRPENSFLREIAAKKLAFDRSNCNIIKYDLSFLDGLGDFYLARESSNLLYKFRSIEPFLEDESFGRKTYNLLRTILATNTLLSKIAVAYNMHRGLKDQMVVDELNNEYIPHIDEWSDPGLDKGAAKYEQEFLADYFEQYVGALFLDQPEVAQDWITEIYENVLFLISTTHRVPCKSLAIKYNYRAWSIDVIGRSIG